MTIEFVYFSNVDSYLQVSKDELSKLVQGFEKQDILTSGGVTLAGSRYIYLSGTDRVIRAKLGKVGVHCVKTQQGKFLSSSLFYSGYRLPCQFRIQKCVGLCFMDEF